MTNSTNFWQGAWVASATRQCDNKEGGYWPLLFLFDTSTVTVHYNTKHNSYMLSWGEILVLDRKITWGFL